MALLATVVPAVLISANASTMDAAVPASAEDSSQGAPPSANTSQDDAAQTQPTVRLGEATPPAARPDHADPDEQQTDHATWPEYHAKPADAVVDTIGVAMHHHYSDTAYGEHDLLAMLERLGVRHIRDAVTPQSMEFYKQFVEQVGPGAGVSYILNDGEPMSVQDQLRLIAEQAPGTASQIESDNEPDCDGWGAGEVESYHDLARDLRAQMDSLPELHDVPLTTPSFCRNNKSSFTTYGDDGVSERFNMHPYTGGELPEKKIAELLAAAREAAPDATPVITEGGFHGAVNKDNEHKPTSEMAQSAYLPQMFLEYAAQGIALTHAYELIDQHDDPGRTQREHNFGLFRADGSIKPSGASLAALTSALRDEGGPAQAT
ncbi:hypothetical protein [Pseudonocardia nigra]|uniref:hypothetical protein n=1 Tax=Pseudonocardia nigra TaxID=1921578 RepID=UPI001C5E06C4|nr:hypothetical protein [Pseudonocardia nigra]